MSSIKIKRIGSEIVRELSSIIFEEVHNDMLKNVTIVDAKVTNDLSLAKIYYTYIGDYDRKEMADELKKASPFLRSELASRIDIRNTPELRFEFDESTLYGEHIDQIINEIHNEK
jgi:ribosome-binding factor A